MKFQKEKKNSSDLKLSIALMASFVILTLQYFLLIIFNLVNTPMGSLVQTVSKLVVAIFFVYAFPAMWARSGKLAIIIYVITVFIFMMHFLFFIPNREHLLELFFSIFFMVLPTFIYTMSLRDFKLFFEITKYASKIVLICGVIIGIFIFSGNASIGVYSMSLSYYMLLPALVLLGDFIDRYRILSFIYFLMSLIIIISLGSRGALLCIACFAILKLIRVDYSSLRKAIVLRLGLVLAISLTIIQMKTLIAWLSDLLKSYGIDSRTLSMLQTDSVSLSGRDSIASDVMNRTIENPFTGIGLAGDRVITGTYSHNLFMEILSDFGIVVGGIIITILCTLIIRALLKSDKFSYDLLVLWVSLGFVHLMVSSTYLSELKFWILAGLIVLVNFNINKRKHTDYE